MKELNEETILGLIAIAEEVSNQDCECVGEDEEPLPGCPHYRASQLLREIADEDHEDHGGSSIDESPSYRSAMIDAGRGRLLR